MNRQYLAFLNVEDREAPFQALQVDQFLHVA